MRRVRRQKNIIIGIVMFALFVMSVGYAIYQKKLDIGGVANIDWKDWNIRILSIDTVDSSNGVDVVKPSHTNTTAKFNSKITKVGGYIKYKIVVKNSGTIDGVLGNVSIEDTSNSVITYKVEGVSIDDELKAGEEATIYVTATYDSSKVDTASSNKSNVTLNLTYVQLEGYVSQKKPDYLILADYYMQDSNWLYGPILKSNVESINFTTSNIVPSDAKGSWDVSNEQNGSIMAWYYDSDGDNLAEITVGQNGGVKANPDSACLFCFLTNATSVDVNNLDTSEVTNMYEFFYNMWSIKELDLSSLDTSKVTNMNDMFGSNSKLEKITFGSNFDTSNVTTMAYMFLSNTSLKELDLSMFDTSKVTSYEWTFIGNNNLTTIYVGDGWDNSSVKNSTDMFTDCTNIVGGSGTTYDSSKVDISMANYETGYFTYKSYYTPSSCFTFDSSTGTITGYDSACTTDVVIPETIDGVTVSAIGDFSFYFMDLNSLVVSDTVKTIGQMAFNYTGLTSVDLGNGVEEVGFYSFADNSIEELKLSKSLKTIGYSAFNSNKIKKISIPDSVTTIEDGAFANNQTTGTDDQFIFARNSDGSINYERLSSYAGKSDIVNVPDSVKIIGNEAFLYCDLTSLSLPDGLEIIGTNAFSYNELTSVVIPDTVTSLYQFAFSYNNLNTITIGTGVTEIDERALINNTNLTKIINKSNRAFDWGLIIDGTSGYNFATGTVVTENGNVEITTN